MGPFDNNTYASIDIVLRISSRNVHYTPNE